MEKESKGKKEIGGKICSKCGYQARSTDAAEFCPQCGQIGTFVPKIDDAA